MKRLIFVLLIMIFGAAFKISVAQDGNGGGNRDFYASLSPYGTWIELNNGLTVWHPLHVRRDWSPYKYGHWIWTDDGWYWDSDEPYGAIVYHYGRWYNDGYYGWIWVPDHVWAPAWVEWRYNDNYIGWAPLAPYASFSIGTGIRFTRAYETPISFWHFVDYRHMCDPYVFNYYVSDRERYGIYSYTRYRTNYGYSNGRVINRGVDVDYIRQRGGGRIVERQIQRVDDFRNTGAGSNDNFVRAYMPREQLAGTNNRNVEIKRTTKPSSLDVSRLGIGNRNPVARNENNSTSDNRELKRTNNNMLGREAPGNNPGNLRENNRQQIRNYNNQPGRMNRPQLRQSNKLQQRVQNNIQRRGNPQQVKRESGNNKGNFNSRVRR
ncbi:MAG: DUF6600 domain-containing protein [Ignavibacteriaceae bacterium]|jgi:hypothetical protein